MRESCSRSLALHSRSLALPKRRGRESAVSGGSFAEPCLDFAQKGADIFRLGTLGRHRKRRAQLPAKMGETRRSAGSPRLKCLKSTFPWAHDVPSKTIAFQRRFHRN
jgi:hypothetical protein